ncbi:methyltransferase [Burkholderia cenocepacia]|uniref:methyltransferase n=1 Tax=Burkholderia cenocepacia TaxID=95486 RepID=UPI0019057800|nr:methyltransferase [Burkholderia cenocepacia]MBJ9696371.1 methyltransferase [Burkholderia cenocepacia]
MTALLSYSAILLTVLVGLSLVISSALTGVPTLSSGRSEAHDVISLLKRAGLSRHAVIVDLGSGWGALVVALARAFPEASVEGVEISLFPYFISRLRTHGLSNVSLRWGNFFHGELGHADAIVCYLMPDVMPKVCELLDRNLKAGTYVVSNTFLFRGRTISLIHRGGLRGIVALYVWPARHWVADGHE